MKPGIRSFMAIELNRDIKGELKIIQDKLKELDLDAKWVEINNIHLTLKFLGNVDWDNLEKVKAILKKTSILFKPFKINLSAVGVFPKVDSPRVIWTGIDKGKNEIIKIASLLDEELKKIAIPSEDREFTPHLTLGRVRSAKNKDRLKNYLGSLKLDFRAIQEVKEIILFQSKLNPAGPAYVVLSSFSFFVP